jgi:hypothetical protein
VNDLGAVLEVAAALAKSPAQWWISGGWAIDLHVGRVTREHHDIDVVTMRKDQAAVRGAMPELIVRQIIPHPEGLMNQSTLQEWPDGAFLRLPVHQTNVYRPGESEPMFQLMFGESEGSEWIYRRDPRVRRAITLLGFEPFWGIPYLAPEIVLLFKAKLMQAKDEADFRSALPVLGAEPRRWLRDALTIANPGHPWIDQL